MHLLDLFESTNEGYTVTRGIDKERYQARAGLEGPFQTKSGKVVYYDKKEGKYYDPDTDIYIDHDDYAALDEGVGTYLKGAVLAGLLGMGVNQMASMTDAKNSPLGQAMAQAAEQGDQYAAKHLEKLDAYFDLNDTGSIKILSQKYLGKTLESVMEEVATTKKSERILKMMRAKHPQAANDMEALLLAYEKGQSQDRKDINTLYSQNREEDREIEELERELEALKKRRGMNEDYYETDEQRELARLGRILMDMGKKRDDDVGAAMGRVGNELTKYGSPEGANSIKKLEQVTGQKESTIMKMMALAQKVQGDVAVGADVEDEEEINEVLRKVPYVGYKGPGSDFRAYDEPDVAPRRTARRDENNYAVLINGKTWKVFARRATAEKAAATIEKKYNKNTEVQATRDPVSESLRERDDDFDRRIHTALGGDPDKFVPFAERPTTGDHVELKVPERYRKAQIAIMRTFAKITGIDFNKLDIDYTTGSRTVMIDGETPHPSILSALNGTLDKMDTGEIPGLYEALDHDIKIGDTVETKKMGQMQGVVTGFSTKTGDTRVMFKHKSGKVYATVPDNLRVISSKKTESQVAENIDLRHDLKPGTYKHKLQNIQVSINDNGSVTFMQPAQWEIEGDQEYLEYVESQLAMPEYWQAELDEGGFFDPDQPNPGDMVKHRNGAVGKVKKIGTQGDETWVYFKDKNGEMNFGQWKKSVFPLNKVDEAFRPTKMRFPGERFSKEVNTQDFELSSMYDHRSIDQLYQSLNVANNAIQKVTLKIEKLQDAGKRPIKTQQALEVLKRKRDYISDLIDQKEMQGEGVELDEAKKKPVPTKPDKWAYAKAQAKKKFDVYPSAYANAWAAKKYKELGGGWRMGKPKK